MRLAWKPFHPSASADSRTRTYDELPRRGYSPLQLPLCHVCVMGPAPPADRTEAGVVGELPALWSRGELNPYFLLAKQECCRYHYGPKLAGGWRLRPGDLYDAVRASSPGTLGTRS